MRGTTLGRYYEALAHTRRMDAARLTLQQTWRDLRAVPPAERHGDWVARVARTARALGAV